MRRLWALGAVLVLVLVAPVSPAEARPRQDAGPIAFVSDLATTSADAVVDEIYFLDPQTRHIDRVTYDLPGVERWPTVSPDGRSLAWVRWGIDADGGYRPDLSEIFRCDLRSRGGDWSCRHPRRVVGPVLENAISWTPDSRSLLYSEPLNAEFDADIYAVDVRSHRTRNLTGEAVLDGALVQNSQPTVSPDGRYVVYSRGSTAGSTGADLYRRKIDGSDPVRLTAAPANDNAADYSPDGTRLVFHSNRDGDADIYSMAAAVEGPANPAVNLTNDLRSGDGTMPAQERAPSFSPDGRQIAFWWFVDLASGFPPGFTDGEIYRMRADGSGVRNLTDNNPTDPAALTVGDIQPDWGPTLPGARHR